MALVDIWQALREKTTRLVGNLSISEDVSQGVFDEWLESLEEGLFRADVAPSTIDVILKNVCSSESLYRNADISERKEHLREMLAGFFKHVHAPLDEVTLLNHSVVVLMLSGVNGSGKTTTMAKLAHHYQSMGHEVFIIGADTYRAAADAQLATWCDRLQTPYFNQSLLATEKSSPATVVTEGLRRAMLQPLSSKTRVVLVDTSGRLHVDAPLMEELCKVKRSIHKVLEAQAPTSHAVASLLVLDATTGQNALKQVDQFMEHVGVDALICTKIDASSRAGVLLSISADYNLQPLYLSAGETMNALALFDPDDYIETLLSFI